MPVNMKPFLSLISNGVNENLQIRNRETLLSGDKEVKMVQVNKNVLKPTLRDFWRLVSCFWKAVWPKETSPYRGFDSRLLYK